MGKFLFNREGRGITDCTDIGVKCMVIAGILEGSETYTCTKGRKQNVRLR